MCPMLGLGGADEKRTSPDLTLVELTFKLLNNSIKSLLLTEKILPIALLPIQKFSFFPPIFFQRILIMDYIHILPFVFIHRSPNFPLCVLKSQPLTKVKGFVEENMFIFSLTETFIIDSFPQVKKAPF